MAPSRDRRPGFSRRAQYGLLATWVLAIAGAVVGAALLVLSSVNPGAFAALRLTVAEVTAPVSTAGAVGIDAVSGVPGAIVSWWNVHGENARLRAELAALQPAAIEGRVKTLENLRLRRLLRLRDDSPGVVVTARIVSSSASSTRRYGLLNAGSWQGVAEGMPVRGPDGLIGRVLEVGLNTSRVLMLTDPESVVPVRRISDGASALVAGRGDGLVDLRTVYTADGRFRPGDVFVTSGSGGIYPPGIVVAHALRAGPDNVPARPFARPSSIDFAIVMRAFLPEPPPPPPGARQLPPSAMPAAPAPTPTPAATPPAPAPSAPSAAIR